MRERATITFLAMLLVITACADAAPRAEDPGTTVPSTPATTTSPPTTTDPTTTSSTEAPTTSVESSALDALEGFITRAELLHVAIVDAATLFNESYESTGVVSERASDFIADLDATPLRRHVPPGLAPELETAVLAVFADLDSRVSALAGGVRMNEYAPDDVLICLGFGATSFGRFQDDWSRMLELAAASPMPTAAPDSDEAGILAVRLEAIQSMNWGCDSCGGVQYDTPFEVDWDARTVLGVEFEATFTGAGWEILIYAC